MNFSRDKSERKLSYAQVVSTPRPGDVNQPETSASAKKAKIINQQVEEVAEIMQQNINKVLQRGENLDSLQIKTEKSKIYKKQTLVQQNKNNINDNFCDYCDRVDNPW
ncbi:Vesicle-associated membrane protein 4 [Smittium culicis]|uniref:Vesicle-associated membrane protein 4 n=1 Tax=Smittium culicis TaxID=133412 RepID=A0A1R1X1Y0_9FUNG|nr:Vesicle-associated membrane protein 4 [Smittium culicis]